jgi:hypothetical protein
MGLGIASYVLLFFLGPPEKVEPALLRWMGLPPLLLLTSVGMLALMVGWAVALIQLVIVAARLARGEPTWKHHLASAILIAVCYGIWILVISSRILIIV